MVQMLVSLYVSLLLLVIVVSGIIMMFRPKLAWQILGNCGISLVIFLAGVALLHSACPATPALDGRWVP